MKKILFVAVMCLFAVMFSGCGGAKTPKDVAEKSIKCLKNKDYKGYVELVSLKDEAKMSSEELKKSREQMAVLLESKISSEVDKKGGIDSYEIGEETIDEDEAKVKATIKYGDGSEKESTIKLKKNEDGDWKIDAGK
ncbi:MAG: DUF4878 domain-containing protein [Prevotella sp.]|jgi:uncharacterized protein YjaZ|nr:DUF4878 domain-containing protein [Prevotella sp.]